jgi:uncharacterized membrane protein (Fun14 family)
MSNTARSIFFYAAHLSASGAALVAIPDSVLGLIGVPSAGPLWPRLFGLLALEIALYLFLIAKKQQAGLYAATILGRLLAAAAFCLLFVLGLGPWPLLLAALIDAASSAWTYQAMKAAASQTNGPA